MYINKPMKRGWGDSVRAYEDSKKKNERRCCRDDNLKIPQDGRVCFKEKRANQED